MNINTKKDHSLQYTIGKAQKPSYNEQNKINKNSHQRKRIRKSSLTMANYNKNTRN